MKTDSELKQLLAKMLPETVHLSHSGELCWSHNYNQDSHLFVRVLDAELLHLCSIVEARLTDEEYMKYGKVVMLDSMGENRNEEQQARAFLSATWQQRVTALAEVEGLL